MRSKLRLSALTGAATLISVGMVPQAHAAVGFAMSPLALGFLTMPAQTSCSSQTSPTAGFGGSAVATVAMTKSEAILGGHVSRLDLIRQEQNGSGATTASFAEQPASSILPIVPAAGGSDCARFALPASKFEGFAPSAVTTPFDPLAKINPLPRPKALPSEDFLASKRLVIQHTVFDRQWSRVSRAGLSRGSVVSMIGSSDLRLDTAVLAKVNRWVNDHIRYKEDSVLYGKADYWADASSTLKLSAGDCEDIAILKMQALAAVGVPRTDMYLTIARDLARNADHAVLIVKMADRYWLLDNSTDAVLDASASYDYRPIFSFTSGKEFLHGY